MWYHFVITDRRGLEIPVLRIDANGCAGPHSRLWEAKQAAPKSGRVCKGQQRSGDQFSKMGISDLVVRLQGWSTKCQRNSQCG